MVCPPGLRLLALAVPERLAWGKEVEEKLRVGRQSSIEASTELRWQWAAWAERSPALGNEKKHVCTMGLHTGDRPVP